MNSLGPHHPPFLFRLIEGHGLSCSPHAVACQGRPACLAAGVHSWTDAASGQTRPRAPVDLISLGSPGRLPRPRGWPGSSLRQAPPCTPSTGTPSPLRCLCAQLCDCAVAAARTPALEHSRPHPVSYIPGETSCAPISSKRAK